MHRDGVQFSSVTQLYPTLCNPMDCRISASLSITNSQSPPKPMSIESVMPSNHLILCRPLLLLPSIFPSIRVFSNESVLLIRWPNSILTLWNLVVSLGQSVWAWRIHNASVSDESGNSKVISPNENFTWLYNAESQSSLYPKQTTFC